MKAVARNHHFVPQGYLAQFTNDGTRDGRVTVFDRVSRSIFQTKPRNVGAKRDFNRIELEGRAPDELERMLGELEGRAISAIRRLQETEGEPQASELSPIVNLMTLLVVRNPQSRRAMNTARRHEARIIGSMLTSDRRMFESQVAKAKRDGFIREAANVSFEEMAEFIQRDEYTIEVSTSESLSLELSIFESIFETLASRWWSLVTASVDAPEFATCDHPVAIVFKDRKLGGPIGYAMPGTEVSFPLGPRHALLGVLEEPLMPRLTASAEQVAAINSRTVYHADRQIYARSRRLVVLRKGGMVDFDLS